MCRTRIEGVARGQDANIEGMSIKIPHVKPTSLTGIIRTAYSVEVYNDFQFPFVSQSVSRSVGQSVSRSVGQSVSR